MMTRSTIFRPIAQEIVFILGQGDQIGRIWAVVYYGQFLKISERTTNIWATFFHGTSCTLKLTKKRFGPQFGRDIHKLHQITLLSIEPARISFVFQRLGNWTPDDKIKKTVASWKTTKRRRGQFFWRPRETGLPDIFTVQHTRTGKNRPNGH
jgi:hypothetical protein